MILIRCVVRSNDDHLKNQDWPTYVACKPDNGDCMQAGSKVLGKVCRVTHAQYPATGSVANEPVLLIEVGKL